MQPFDLNNYGPAARTLITKAFESGLPATLPFATPDSSAKAELAALSDDTVGGGRTVLNQGAADCCRSALWLLFDYYEESHNINQDVPSISGSYWHGICHRREPDPGNAMYWFRKVGDHPIFPDLLDDAKEIVGDDATGGFEKLLSAFSWDPNLFIELCTSGPDEETRPLLLQIQKREWQILFNYDFKQAFGE